MSLISHSPLIRLVYPKPEDKLFAASTFLLGQLSPDTTVLLNGEPVIVSPEGFFSHGVTLEYGDNHFEFAVSSLDPSIPDAVETIILHRELPLSAAALISQDDASLVLSSLLSNDYAGLASDTLPFWMVLPTGCKARVSFWDGQTCVFEVPLVESEPEAALNNPLHRRILHGEDTVFGHPCPTRPAWTDASLYIAAVSLARLLPFQAGPDYIPTLTARINLTLSSGEPYELALPGRVTVWQAAPQVEVVSDKAVTRDEPVYGERLTPQPAGAILTLTAQREGWVREADGGAWLQLADCRFLDLTDKKRPSVQDVRYSIDGDWLVLAVDLTESLSFLDVSSSANAVQCQFLAAVLKHPLGLTVPESWRATGIEKIQLRTVDDGETMSLTLTTTVRLLGYDYDLTSHNEQMTLTVRLKTMASLTRPLRVLIDAGHGGEEHGAIIPNGTPEKTANLHLARLLCDALARRSEVTCQLTREADVAMTLVERVTASTTWDADMFISLHHNALPDNRDPMAEHGVSSFYWEGHSAAFATTCQEAMASQSDFANYGVVRESFAVCRQTRCMAVLLECGFVTYPADVALMLNPEHQSRVLNAIASALVPLLA